MQNTKLIRGIILGLIFGILGTAGAHDMMQERQERLIVANGCGHFDQTSGDFSWQSNTTSASALAIMPDNYYPPKKPKH